MTLRELLLKLHEIEREVGPHMEVYIADPEVSDQPITMVEVRSWQYSGPRVVALGWGKHASS